MPNSFDIPHEPSKPFNPPQHWQLLDAANVDDWECAPLTWVIEPMIATENVVLIAAPSQTGKTMLGLYMASTIATGQKFLDRFDTKKSKVLYVVLEDPVRRIRDRLKDLNAPKSEPCQLMLHVAPGFNLGDARMFEYLEKIIAADKFTVVFLDTYQRATPGLASFDDEKQSAILHQLADITRKHKIALIILDHLRKANNAKPRKDISIDDIKGTGGKTQNADSVILLQRQGTELKLQCSSKDSDCKIAILLKVSAQGGTGPKFQYVGELQADSESVSTDKVLNAIKPGEEVSSGELCERTGYSAATVRRAARQWIDKGVLTTNGKNGRWLLYKKANRDGVPINRSRRRGF
jgi:hypothetical protein